MTDRIFIPIAQVRPGGLLVYSAPEPPFSRKTNKFAGQKTYSGKVSAGAAKRIRKTINVFLLKSPTQHIVNPVTMRPLSFRLTFVTLTISSQNIIEHREAYKKGLEPMLLQLRRKIGGLYLWKAELQRRGQIHWHLTLNRFVHHTWLRETWNNIQSKAGWLDDYRARTGHIGANSTDIHAVWKIDRIDLYLAKYMSKSDPTVSIKGKVWGCSQALQNAKYYEFVMEGDSANWVDCEIETGAASVKVLEHCTIVESQKGRLLVPPAESKNYAQWAK